MGREENRLIFEDTERLCKTDDVLIQSTKSSIKTQKMIPEYEELETVNREKFKEKANLVVSKKRTFQAAKEYEGKTVVHNFASASNPGGGVVTGAGAQEECLCRCSNLYFCLNTKEMWENFYGPHRQQRNPLHNDDIIYTHDVTVFKSDTMIPELMNKEEWYQVDVITCAAPNLRSKPSNKYNSGDGDKSVSISDKDLLELHKKRLRRMLDVIVLEGAENVILGAFGCGAFMNKPEVVARAAKEVIVDYMYAFKNIEFAVYCGRDMNNYTVFERAFKSLKNKS